MQPGMSKRKQLSLILLVILLCTFIGGRKILAGSMMDKFIDPSDGKFDASDWLLKHKGFLPVPIIVTEPAVGFGAGAALLFFHQSLDEKIAALQTDSREDDAAGKKKRLLPPSISGLMGMKTENDTWAVGGFHFGSWKKDRIRYTGGAAKVSVNLAYYGKGENSFFKNGIDYNLEGWGLLQEIQFRLRHTDVFLGGKFTYFDAKSTFDFSRLPIGIEQWEMNFKGELRPADRTGSHL